MTPGAHTNKGFNGFNVVLLQGAAGRPFTVMTLPFADRLIDVHNVNLSVIALLAIRTSQNTKLTPPTHCLLTMKVT